MPAQRYRPEFDRFRWQALGNEELAAWQHGRTGYPLVDAGMRNPANWQWVAGSGADASPTGVRNYPGPLEGLPESRERALDAYQQLKDA